jgi:hypothetical protein
MLPINSTKDVVPGGPVSSVEETNEILAGAPAINRATARSTSGSSTIVRGGIFAVTVATARRILQHCVAEVGACGLAGLEWNGQALAASGFGATAAKVQ